MIVISTTPTLEGMQIRDYLGIVTGEVIVGAGGSMLMVSVSGTAVRF